MILYCSCETYFIYLNCRIIRFCLEGQPVFDQIAAMESAIGVPLITPEFQACAFLYNRGPSPSHHLQGALRTSPAGFHNVKRRLIERGIIVGRKSTSDARVTLYDLTDNVRRLLDSRIIAYQSGGRFDSLAPSPSLADAAY